MSRRQAVVEKAIPLAAADGFSDRILSEAGRQAGLGPEMLLHLFPRGAESLVEAFSDSADAAMVQDLARQDLAVMKIRKRIHAAVLARIGALRPHKEAARRAAAFLMLPMHAALAALLLYRTVDAMWHAAGDTSTDFNFYTKRAILAALYSATMMRWFNDTSDGESETLAFLDARIENVMQFERFKVEIGERAKKVPGLEAFFSPKRS
ncbi:MAG: COQ9 family protein [Alphaproteobacteria bacterium]|nr:COQ9 family protein [Alphaproteobacteria bacterium]MBV9694394.1 COQ9 family protein [Alphaproteobacteria bacterium]